MKGFVDLQVNGYLGIDFSEPGLKLDQVREVVERLRERGTVAFCPTMITSSETAYEQNLPVLAQALKEPDLTPHLLGIHLEGPFISPEDGARGAHDRGWVLNPDVELYEKFRRLAEDQVCLVTVAPERPGAEELIRHIRVTGAAVSLGHHYADARAISRSCELGACAATHLGNGIPNHMPRHPNPIWYQLDEDRLVAMVIVDGHHVPDEFVRVVARVKGLKQFIVVSDAAPVAGMPPGRYDTLGQSVVLEESGKLWNPEKNCLAGSSASMMECMNHLAAISSLREDELWLVGYRNPLALIGKQLEDERLAHLPPVVFQDRRFAVGGAAR
ncbi:MAG: N-acetylglucosamine-6-phosphate deacetylase [Acidobacteriota bacterium]